MRNGLTGVLGVDPTTGADPNEALTSTIQPEIERYSAEPLIGNDVVTLYFSLFNFILYT